MHRKIDPYTNPSHAKHPENLARIEVLLISPQWPENGNIKLIDKDVLPESEFFYVNMLIHSYTIILHTFSR